MGMVFRLMVFLIMFNLATAMVGYIFGAGDYLMPVSQQSGTQLVDNLDAQMSVSGGTPVEEPGLLYRFIDIINVGFFNKIKLYLNATIFAAPTLLVNTGLLDEALLGYFQSIITLIMIFGMFEIFTGRDLFGR